MDIVISSQMLLSVVYTTTIFARGITVLGSGLQAQLQAGASPHTSQDRSTGDAEPSTRPRSHSARAGTGVTSEPLSTSSIN
jgi:hypothetical protein